MDKCLIIKKNQSKNKNKSTYEFIASVIKYKYANKSSSNKQTCQPKLFDICQSNLLTIDSVITYINQHEEEGVLDYLINIIHSRFLGQSFFYLNQIIILLTYKKNYYPIEQYLIDKCIKHLKFSIRISLFLNYFPKGQTNIQRMKFNLEQIMRESFSRNVQDSKLIVTKKLTQNDFIINNSSNYGMDDTKIYYYYKCLEFFDNLKKLCLLLFNYPIESTGENKNKPNRKKVLREFVDLFNTEIESMRAEDYKHYSYYKNHESKIEIYTNLNKGYILPFNSDSSNLDSHCWIIVNILPEFCSCFNTKERVPVKLTCECIELGEANNFFELYKNFYGNYDDKSSEICCSNILTKQLSLTNEKKLKIFDKWKNLEKNLQISKDEENNNNQKKNYDNTIDKVIKEDKVNILFDDFVVYDYDNESMNPFGEPKEKIFEKVYNNSAFKNFSTYRIKCFIAKANDDLIQEMFALQLIKKFEEIFKQFNIFIKSYEVIITSETSGLIEFLNNASSIDGILKTVPKGWDLNKFYRTYFKGEKFKRAQKNFADSLVGFCLLSYYLEIKDRHNGNIMIDNKGHIMHIDFGFLLGSSPKNLGFERAQFKLTKSYVDILDGFDSKIFKYFRNQMVKGLIESKKHFEIIATIIKITYHSNLQCFVGQNIDDVINNLHKKFLFGYNQKQVENYVDELIKNNYENFWTHKYDMFQYWTNGIYY